MADYRLSQSGDEVQQILNTSTPVSSLEEETERAERAEQTLQGNIDNEETRAKGAERTLQENIDAEALTRGQAERTLQENIDAEETRAKAAEKQNADDIDAIEEKIPEQASSSNQLADKQFVNSSIQTSTAEYKGAFNSVSDLHLTTSATRLQIAAALPNVIQSADNNDYCFVQIPAADATPTVIASVERYKYNGSQWLFEYALNNSGFTQAQWDALNSGITSGLVAKLSALPTNAELTTLLAGKQAVIADLQTIREGAAAGATAVQPAALQQEAETRAAADTALGNRVTTIEGKIPVAASPQNQLADKQYVDDGISTATAEFKGAYNLVTDLHLTITATRSEIATELGAVISGADNNDYAYVQIPVANDTPTTIAKVERYKYNGSAWAFEYELNNSGFTAAQWDAINSGITSGLVSKLSDLPTLAQLSVLLNGKQNTLTFDTAPTEGSSNPVTSAGIFSGIASAIAAALTAYYTKAQTYSQTEVQQLISTTIASYYTKSEVDAAIANFITKSVNDLTNYYLKSETFTKAEVNQLIAAVQQFTYQSVAELPTASAETMNKIYLVPSTNPQQQNVKDEYITIAVTDQGTTTYSWEQIGSTTVDLSGYYTSAQTDAAISNALNTALASYSTTTQMTAAIATAIANYYTKAEVDALIANFITKAVSDLANYYLKSETYNKTEVDAMVAAIQQFQLISVQTLPTASADTMNKIYLVPGTDPQTHNVKDEYITLEVTDQGTTTYSWECIGSTEISLDNYYTKSQTDNAISGAITLALADYSTTSQVGTIVSTAITTALANYYTKTQVDNELAKKTSKLTMTGAGAAVEDDILVVDENGNIKDGGKKISDLQLKVTDCAMLGGGFPTCTTAGGTAAKTVSISHFLLLPNCRISVLFQNAFTATNPTLSINGGAAIAIRHFGRAMEIGKVHANTILTMVYDGTYWQVVGIEGITGSTPSGAIDLALPSGLLWCEHNVGAASPYEDGLYFSWGNITGHTGDDGYDFGTANDGPYASTPGAALTGDIPAGNDYDAARHNMGAPWRMPTVGEFQELNSNCDSIWTDEDGVEGRRFTSRINGNSIFFPASGYRRGMGLNDRGANGSYWSASLSSQTYGCYLLFGASGVTPAHNYSRYHGFSVRAVQ